ncbi:protein-disulfide reductase DsbD domain-containing protein [Chelativorans sp. Marseille-P2723]|uniref:protein-disulfide reductase DsbD domain-containing protein n=1 Tax=Chelativorans sp. Marseille-P2723 TaxID=2709133 RepID=UPI00156FC716|nr:protein-disulfide reductase DsbD domain-containing protein [Chelativorans sp. Marseille-P2723]
MLRPICLFLAIAFAPLPAMSASTNWMEVEGGSLRLVTSGLSDEAGRLRGAVEIKLNPGWKTYWRNPGEAGIPPQIELKPSQLAVDAEIFFPAPQRISDPYAEWAGYPHPVTLPVIFTLSEPEAAGVLEGSIFLGICEMICIPVEMPFSFDAGAYTFEPEHAAIVNAAFAGLPADARRGFQLLSARRQGVQVLFEVELPEGSAEPVLFVAPPDALQLSFTKLQGRRGDRATFSADILHAREAAEITTKLDYTLVAGDEAVAGRIHLSP